MAAVKLMFRYTHPTDEVAFWHHNQDVHLSLVSKIPGLQKITFNRVGKVLMGSDATFIIAKRFFADHVAFDAVMDLTQTSRVGGDIMRLSPGLSTPLMMTEVV